MNGPYTTAGHSPSLSLLRRGQGPPRRRRLQADPRRQRPARQPALRRPPGRRPDGAHRRPRLALTGGIIAAVFVLTALLAPLIAPYDPAQPDFGDVLAEPSWSHWLAVMYLGQIVEQAPTTELFASPKHPYTQALLSAAPVPDPVEQRSRERIVLHGDLPGPLDPPAGCRFHTRCPLATDRCRTEVPALRELPGGRQISCHLVGADGTAPDTAS